MAVVMLSIATTLVRKSVMLEADVQAADDCDSHDATILKCKGD
jgi:hypothetical protein